jgi:hypothetical protein
MPTLTKTQLDHAKQKVENTRNKALAKFRESLGDEPVIPEYTADEKKAMILDGRARPKKDLDFEENVRYVPFSDLFDYPTTGAMVEAADNLKVWEAALKVEQKRLAIIEERLIDELIMSPDGMAALAKIAAAFGE